MWNKTLGSFLATYPNAVLSIADDDGYPASVRCSLEVDIAQQTVMIPRPPIQAKSWRGHACLLFHEHDAHLESLRQLVLLGELTEQEGSLVFYVKKFVTANGRTDSDQMPHASSPFHMLTFFWGGWRNAQKYLAKRGAPWPAVPYDEVARLIAEEP
jgi:hypothetical protein